MADNKQKALNLVLKPNTNIGSVSAEEDDYFLSKCFVETSGFDAICDMESSKCILLGRTGAGKSTIIQRLISTKDHCSEIDPQSLSLNYISNSRILNIVNELGVDLDLFYQLIWRHALAIELIQCKQEFENMEKAESFFNQLRSKFSANQRKKKALDQMEDYSNDLFGNTSDRIKNITKNIEADLSAKIDFEKLGIPLSLSGGLKLQKETQEEIIHTAQAVVNSIDIRGLSDIIDILADDVLDDPMQEFFIVIDELDEQWVNSSVKYNLIRALVESIKKFRKIRNAKVVISLREDLLEKVLKETRFEGGQEEKFEDLYLRIKWKPWELRTLVEKRLQWLFEDKYTNHQVAFPDIFPNKVQDDDPLDYMLDRTLYRPRDIIQFINFCFESSEGQTRVTAKTIREAEATYSKRRYAALIQEWEIVNPLIEGYFVLLDDQKSKFALSEFTKDNADDFAIGILQLGPLAKLDSVGDAANNYSEGSMSRRNFLRVVVQELYKTGVIGVKNSQTPCSWSYLHEPTISQNEITDESDLYIHPMLWRHLGVFQNNVTILNIRQRQ